MSVVVIMIVTVIMVMVMIMIMMLSLLAWSQGSMYRISEFLYRSLELCLICL